jgi:hypothetical protein
VLLKELWDNLASFLWGLWPFMLAGGRTKDALVVRWQPAAIALSTSTLVFIIFPALAHTLALRELRAHPPIPTPGPYDEIVTDGIRMTGFLVIPDAEADSRPASQRDYRYRLRPPIGASQE